MISVMAESIEVVHPQGRPKPRIISASALDLYLSRGFVVVGELPSRPAESAYKGDWVAYAESLGLEVGGLTKDEVVAAVAELEGQAEDGE